VTVRVSEKVPALPKAGLSELIVGGPTVTFEAVDVAPPGLCTVMARTVGLVIEAASTVAVMLVAVPAVTVSWVDPM
jgi:hypothetical protein